VSALPDDWRSWSEADKARLLWRLQARPNQLTPAGNWNIWLILAGRGWGKTRTGAEDVADYGSRMPQSRIAVVAPTIADARDTCVEGESGLLNCLPSGVIAKWNRSMGELVLKNGTLYKCFSSEEPERLRGPQHHRAWADELAAWKYLDDTWDQLMFGLRLKASDGSNPQVVCTTTPKPLKFLKNLIKRTDVHITKGSTDENKENLSAAALAQLYGRYAGTRLGRQELNAEILDDVEGALWTHEMIEESRLVVPEGIDIATVVDQLNLVTIVVGVDPAVTAKKTSDETGIVIAGRSRAGHGYVLADMSGRYSPDQWARKVVRAYDMWDADRIVPEVNNGGDLVAANIMSVDPYAKIKPVHASRGKIVRAEPVAALYEQKKIHHVGHMLDLEDQMTSYSPEDATESPDRLDALVWALTDMFIATKEIKHIGGSGGSRLRGRR
jgi:phage terminase large subunit-like protein